MPTLLLQERQLVKRRINQLRYTIHQVLNLTSPSQYSPILLQHHLQIHHKYQRILMLTQLYHLVRILNQLSIPPLPRLNHSIHQVRHLTIKLLQRLMLRITPTPQMQHMTNRRRIQQCNKKFSLAHSPLIISLSHSESLGSFILSFKISPNLFLSILNPPYPPGSLLTSSPNSCTKLLNNIILGLANSSGGYLNVITTFVLQPVYTVNISPNHV
jgi:hypothetical protein